MAPQSIASRGPHRGYKCSYITLVFSGGPILGTNRYDYITLAFPRSSSSMDT